MTHPSILLWLGWGGLLITCFAAVGARCLRKFSRRELEVVCRNHDNIERFGEVLRQHDRVALAVEILVAVATSVLMVAGAFWAWSAQAAGWIAFGITAVVLALIASAVIVWIPWAVSRLFAETIIYHTWWLFKYVSVVVEPLVWGARSVDFVLQRATGRTPEIPDEESFEEEIRAIVSEGHREGLLEEDAREMIEGVMELGDADVGKIMTPRTEMHMIHIDMPWDELIEKVVNYGHTRIPVYNESRDDIVGVLYSKDLLPQLAKNAEERNTSLPQLMRKHIFVPETKPVDDLLEMFQQMRTHIAIVVDEYGGVAGLVTIEDALEEIVGEIVDEYDDDLVEELECVDDCTWEALGKAHVDEINHALKLSIPEDADYDTIAGFVFTQLGRVPREGETFDWEDSTRITVIEATRRRIERVRIEHLGNEQRESA